MHAIDVTTILILTAANLATVSIALPLIMGRGISRAALAPAPTAAVV